jgi:hypothetical protein
MSTAVAMSPGDWENAGGGADAYFDLDDLAMKLVLWNNMEPDEADELARRIRDGKAQMPDALVDSVDLRA